MDVAWQIGFEHDVAFSTVTYSRHEFGIGPCSESTLFKNVINARVMAYREIEDAD